MKAKFLIISAVFLMIVLSASSCNPTAPSPIDRYSKITGVKVTPVEDHWLPVIAEGWSQPEPLPSPVNTAGGEDSPFILPDGQTLYFFFTPDVNIPVEKQISDGLTGIWFTNQTSSGWSEPERVWLERPSTPALDGCEFVLGNVMWFCSIRAGNYRQIDFYTAQMVDGFWTNWHNLGKPINGDYQVGEMTITSDGLDLYFASNRPGGFGGYDLWVSHKTNEGWGEPENLSATVNSENDENHPFVTVDGQELWFDGLSISGHVGPAVFRSQKQPDGTWGIAQEIVSTFAGEPALSGDGQILYFVHAYYPQDLSQMLEADIYVSLRLP